MPHPNQPSGELRSMYFQNTTMESVGDNEATKMMNFEVTSTCWLRYGSQPALMAISTLRSVGTHQHHMWTSPRWATPTSQRQPRAHASSQPRRRLERAWCLPGWSASDTGWSCGRWLPGSVRWRTTPTAPPPPSPAQGTVPFEAVFMALP